MQQWLYNRLSEVKRIKEELAELKVQRESLLSCLLPSGISYEMDKVKSSPEDPMLKIYAKIDEVDNKTTELQANMMDAIDRVCDIINLLDGCLNRKVMMLWYIKDERADVIAEELHYSVDWIYRIHRKSVRMLEDKKSLVKSN